MKLYSLATLGMSVAVGLAMSSLGTFAAENPSPQQPGATKSWAELDLEARQLGLTLDRSSQIENSSGEPLEKYTANNGWRAATSTFGQNLTQGNNVVPAQGRRNSGVGSLQYGGYGGYGGYYPGYGYYSHGGFYGLGAGGYSGY